MRGTGLRAARHEGRTAVQVLRDGAGGTRSRAKNAMVSLSGVKCRPDGRGVLHCEAAPGARARGGKRGRV
jgi:hypothetical protein